MASTDKKNVISSLIESGKAKGKLSTIPLRIVSIITAVISSKAAGFCFSK